MEPTFANSKAKFEEHLRFLTSQIVREWQEVNEVTIDKIDFTIVNGKLNEVKVKLK